jgi:hypothetical protein
MNRYAIPINPKATYFAAIGVLASRWGWIENQSGVVIRELLRIKKAQGHMATGNLGIFAKTRIMASPAEHLFKQYPLGDQIAALADAIQKFDTFRNDVLHGLWVYYPEKSQELALLRTKSIQQKVDPLPDKDVVKNLPRKITELREIQLEALRVLPPTEH